MRIPTPDGVLISLFERLFEGPQRRGVPLPALLVVTEHAPAAASMLCALATTLSGPWWVTMGWGALFATFATYAWTSSRELRAHATGWNPDLARSYRAHAALMRDMVAPTRAAFLVVALCVATGAGLASAALGPFSTTALMLIAFAIQAASLLAMILARCVLPIDPDATSHERELGTAPSQT